MLPHAGNHVWHHQHRALALGDLSPAALAALPPPAYVEQTAALAHLARKIQREPPRVKSRAKLAARAPADFALCQPSLRADRRRRRRGCSTDSTTATGSSTTDGASLSPTGSTVSCPDTRITLFLVVCLSREAGARARRRLSVTCFPSYKCAEMRFLRKLLGQTFFMNLWPVVKVLIDALAL